MRNIFKWYKTTFLQNVDLKNKGVSRVNLSALISGCILSHEPICFVSRTSPSGVYFINNFHAASISIKNMSKNTIIRSLDDELTKKHMVPIKTKFTSKEDKEVFEQIISSRSIPTDCRTLIKRGILNSQTSKQSQLPCSREDPSVLFFHREPDGMVKSYVNFNNIITKRYVPGYLEKGFDRYEIDSHECSKKLCNKVHDYYYKIATQVLKEVSKLGQDISSIRKDPEGIFKRNEQQSYFAMSVIKGLVSVITGGLDDNANNLFMKAALNGYSDIHQSVDPFIVNYSILSRLCLGNLDEPYRGMSTCLPMSGIGYGFLSDSKKFNKDDIPDEFKISLPRKNLENLANIIFENDLDIHSSDHDIITAIYRDITVYPLEVYSPLKKDDLNYMLELRNMGIQSPKILLN
jgi:hypothetical protein